MAIIKSKPTSPGRRGQISVKSDLYKGKPHKSLTESKLKNGGRNNNGRITVRHQGGGHKQNYRIIDFKRDKFDIPAEVERIEYDPNRSAHIALLKYHDGERRYIIAPSKIKIGDRVISSGLGGLYPKGILIGWVSEIRHEQHELFKTARLESAVDFNSIEEVFVIILSKSNSDNADD